MEVLSIIPVRGGSKGIPGKNIKLLAGKPLVAYTIEASLKSKYITRTVVSTEDTKIKSVSESFGAEVIDRPAELAQDETKTAPVMLQVLDALEKQGLPFDRKPFRAHITLARRVELPAPPTFSAQPVSMTVESISLMQSERVRGKLIYRERFVKRAAQNP